ncbi:hypothetical protein COB52_03175 [Candidatus Kaiserbacteria bacterium]|nr:MAG: hypothetical protein COB52_03175 [Candidatus Kaiserbacteria bacterium]
MHLAPLSFDDLNSYAYIQRPTGAQGMKNVTADYLNELHKDTLLEKILFLAVSYFCVGTELRFLATKQTEYTSKDAEIWHAKAMHTVCTFLPLECPLVSHVINSYMKHHLSVKEKEKLEKK